MFYIEYLEIEDVEDNDIKDNDDFEVPEMPAEIVRYCE